MTGRHDRQDVEGIVWACVCEHVGAFPSKCAAGFAFVTTGLQLVGAQAALSECLCLTPPALDVASSHHTYNLQELPQLPPCFPPLTRQALPHA